MKIRDAIAHGRVKASLESFPVTLYKFGKKDAAGYVSVEYAEVLTAAAGFTER